MITKVKGFLQEYKLAFFSGIMLGTSWIPFPPWALLFWLVPVAWYWWNHKDNLKKLVISAWITGSTLTFIGFYWVAFVSHVHGDLPWAIAIPIMIAFCLLSTYFLPLSIFIWHFLIKKFKVNDLSKIILLFSILALTERYYWAIFKWNFGYPFLWFKLPIYQLADVVGFHGLSQITFFLNAIFFIAFLKYKNSENYKRMATAGVFVFLVLNVLGWLNVQRLPKPDRSFNVLLVQANIGNAMKMLAQKTFTNHVQILDRYINLTDKAFLDKDQPIDYVVWPETAIPVRLSGELNKWGLQNYLRKFIQRTPAKLLAGSYHVNKQNNRTSNTFYFFNSDATLASPPHKKTILLAFGEYFPFYDRSKIMRAIADRLNIGSFEPGIGAQAIDSGGVLFGPQICYESLFPYFSIGLAKAGSQVFVNLTNDSWYGPTSEPYQNLYITLARGIEQRRPTIRATNTGISTVMLADGTKLRNSPLFKEWAGVYEVPYHSKPIHTFYQAFPDLLTYLLILITISTLIIGVRKNES